MGFSKMKTPFPPRNGVSAKLKPKTSLYKGHPMHYQSLTAALEQYSGNLTHNPASPCISTVKRKVV